MNIRISSILDGLFVFEKGDPNEGTERQPSYDLVVSTLLAMEKQSSLID